MGNLQKIAKQQEKERIKAEEEAIKEAEKIEKEKIKNGESYFKTMINNLNKDEKKEMDLIKKRIWY